VTLTRDKVFLVGPAIKTEFWLEFYQSASNSKNCDIEIIFVGHNLPDFNLPENFHFIYSNKTPTECAILAYEKAYRLGKESDFVQNTADDVLYSENHFDRLISAYREQEEKYGKEELIMCGPASYNGDEQNIMALFPHAEHWDQRTRDAAIQRAGGTEKDLGSRLEGPSLPTGNFSTIKTSKALGGINTTFQALYWDCDQAMVCHSMGGKVVIFGKEKVEAVKERKYSKSRLYSIHGHRDYDHLCSIWDVRSHDGETWTVIRKEKN
tara:strand:- start:665 stop:1462 length:798 start_codon:yes stop_codon:yes gene_type:complete